MVIAFFSIIAWLSIWTRPVEFARQGLSGQGKARAVFSFKCLFGYKYWVFNPFYDTDSDFSFLNARLHRDGPDLVATGKGHLRTPYFTHTLVLCL